MAIPDLSGYNRISQDLWEQGHKKGDKVWNFDDGLWRQAQYDNPDGNDVGSRYVSSGGNAKIYATATQQEFDWGLYNAGLLLREPVPLSESTQTYQDAQGKEITEAQAAVIDSKRHPELLQDPDFLARHPELAPPSYTEYGIVALGILAIGGIAYVAYKAFRVKR